MSSACTCHINPETCWWCLYEKEKEKSQRYEKALREIAYEDIPGWSSQDVLGKVVDIAIEALKEEEK